jgi:16S rRNA (uracil1498-N3)-methyltransferase
LFVSALTDTVDVGGEDGHHLARVLRLRPGEVVTAADGQGAWRPYVVTALSADGVRLEARGGALFEPEPAFRLAVAFALTKADKPEFTVQKLTELGVDRILPVLAARSIARPNRAAAAVERWRRVALEAARQSRRAQLPEVAELAPLDVLAGHPALIVAERGGGTPARLGPPPGGELLVVVGPEGGLTESEVNGLGPWARVGLGPHILRAETASLAAAAVLSTSGRWAPPEAGAAEVPPERRGRDGG